jgi:two-component system, NarL family, nitrate/nitrite response regulator NarL
MKKLCLLENQQLVIHAFKDILKDCFEVEVVNTNEGLLKASCSLKPEKAISLANICLLDQDAILKTHHSDSHFIENTVFYTTHREADYFTDKIKLLIRLGARGIAIDPGPSQLSQAIVCIENKSPYFCNNLSQQLVKMIHKETSYKPNLLTKRELEVLKAMASGLSSKQIATQFKLCTRTVETHRYNIMKKLNSTNTAQVIQIANKLKLIS